MTLDIIIVNWNTAVTTKKCVRSILKHIKDISCQITIVDNASTDNSLVLLKTIKSNRIKIIKNSKNLGYAKACNIGSSHSKAKYLLFLNSDIELTDNSLIKMFDYLSKNLQIGLIGPRFLNPDQSVQSSVFPPQTVKNAIKEYWLDQQTYLKYTPRSKKPISVWAVSGGAVLIKNSFFKKIGGWDEKYFMYFEDLALSQKVHHHQKQVYYYPQATLVHHHGQSGKSLGGTKDQWKKLIPSSKIYHGLLKHYLLFFILWTGQKWQKLLKKSKYISTSISSFRS